MTDHTVTGRLPLLVSVTVTGPPVVPIGTVPNDVRSTAMSRTLPLRAVRATSAVVVFPSETSTAVVLVSYAGAEADRV